MKLKLVGAIVSVSILLGGCVSVPTYSDTEKVQALESQPKDGFSRIYVYRDNTPFGAALRKDIAIDGKCLGQSSMGVFFFRDVTGNCEHEVSTQSEFSPNSLTLYTEANKKYYLRQYMKLGVFVGGANLEVISEEEALKDLEKCKLAVPGTCPYMDTMEKIKQQEEMNKQK